MLIYIEVIYIDPQRKKYTASYFEQAGVAIPFPQLQVAVHEAVTGAGSRAVPDAVS